MTDEDGAHGRPADWTSHWTLAAGFALTSWPKDPARLADPVSARLLELALESAVLRERLVVHAHAVLPDRFELVTGLGPWPAALGRIKCSFTHWDNGRRGTEGTAWRERVRVLPLGVADLRRAVEACHRAPVVAGLAGSPADYPFTSWRRLYQPDDAPFLTPVPDARSGTGRR